MKARLQFERTDTAITLGALTINKLRLKSDPTTEHSVDLMVGATLENAGYGEYYLNCPLVTSEGTVDVEVTGFPARFDTGQFEYWASGYAGAADTGGPVAGSYTLGQLVTKYRRRLVDEIGTPLWSDDEFTEFIDMLQKMICADFRILEDRSTTSVCSVDLVQGSGLVSVSPRITHIVRGRVDGETAFLTLKTSAEMDDEYGADWESASVTQDMPTILVTKGMGLNKVYLYPPLDVVAGGTLKLAVYRLPLVDLDYTTHNAQYLEIDKYVHLLFNGVMWQAYLKQDADTYDPKKAEQHRVFWEGKDGSGGDKDKIQRMVLREHVREGQSVPHYGLVC
jgi:hypothetical protein